MTEPRTDPVSYQCPFCKHEPYKDVLYAMAHLENKHPDEYAHMLVPGPVDALSLPPATVDDYVDATPPAPRNLLQDDGLRVCITYDETNLHELEEALGDFIRLSADGPQVKILVGEDFAEGWMPLHAHHTVVVFNEDAHPFTLTPAAARALGLRE